MEKKTQTNEDLLRENQALRLRLDESEAMVRAISGGEVDAFLVNEEGEEQVLVLDGADRPYRTLVENMQQGAVTLAAEGVIAYANGRFSDMLGVPRWAVIGVPFADRVPEHDVPLLGSLYESARAGGGEAELTLLCADGKRIPAHVTATRLFRRTEVICLIVTDLTQQKSHEEERLRLSMEQAARAESDRQKDEFLAVLAHELRNPLAPIRNGLQVLNIIGSKEDAARRIREMMGRQVENLVRLVDDLLDVKRLTQGKIDLHKELVDLNSVIARAVESSRPYIEERRHELELPPPGEALPVEADVLRLTQILTNLLNNAAKFTPRCGRIQVSVERLEGPGEPGVAVIRVKDNGVGIAPEMLSRVFDLFAQADASASRSEGGLGIGLTLARRLAEMHGGSIEAASAGRGEGSCFSLRLPLAVPTTPRRSAVEVTAEGASSAASVKRRILVVEDNADTADSMAILLRLLGHQVSIAHSGPGALTAVAEHRPDLVLLDIGLPGMSGYDVARMLRKENPRERLRLIALTGYGAEEDRRKTVEAGFDGHLVKPIDLENLARLVASWGVDP